MIINQFTTFPYGGAGAAAVRHHLEMRRQKVDSRLFVKREVSFAAALRKIVADQIEFADIDAMIEPAKFLDVPNSKPRGFFAASRERRRRKRVCRQYEQHLQSRPETSEVFSMPGQYDRTRTDPHQVQGDVVHLHWVSFFLDLPSFFHSIPRERPIVWTLHDMNSFTGGCHYGGSCQRYTDGCGNCPLVENSAPNDVSAQGWQVKRRALAGRQLTVVTPSHWLSHLAQQSPIWPRDTEFQVIPYGFDTRTYHPVDKLDARRRLVLPEEPFIIAFGADDVGNPRKGFSILKEALAQIAERCPVQLMVFGQADPDTFEGLRSVHHLGYIDQPRVQALAYSAADLFVLPSLEDNLPQTGLEAMACGTPVVAFDTGGIPEFVLPGQTGLLAKAGDAERLANQVIDLIEQPKLRKRLAVGARRLVESEFELGKQTRRYLELYARLGAGTQQRDSRRRAA